MKILVQTEYNWKAKALFFDPDLDSSLSLPISFQETLGIAWLKNLREVTSKKKLSLLIVCTGRHRSGKSLGALTLSYIMDPTFAIDPKKRIITNPEDFLNLIIQLEKEKTYCPCIIIDEAGVTMAADTWYDSMSKALNKSTQVIGFLHPTIFYVTPNKDFVLSQTRKMFHAQFNFDKENAPENFTILSHYNLKFNVVREKPYKKKPLVNINNQLIQIGKINFGLAPKPLLDFYQSFEQNEKPLILKDLASDLRNVKTEEVRKEANLDSLVELVVRNYDVLKSSRAKALDAKIELAALRFWLREKKFKLGHRDFEDIKFGAERVLNNKFNEIKRDIKIAD